MDTKYPKSYWKDKSPGGFYWYWFNGQFHCFSKYIVGKGYINFRCIDKDIEDGSLEMMIEDGITR